jgi:hypothetical protein
MGRIFIQMYWNKKTPSCVAQCLLQLTTPFNDEITADFLSTDRLFLQQQLIIDVIKEW